MKLNQETIINETQVKIKAKVNQTEDQTKVENSILNIVNGSPTIRITENKIAYVEGDLSLLERVKNIILKNEQEELISNILEKNRADSLLKFYINKQSALNNNIHLIDESMSLLGDIEVEIDTDYPNEVIEWFCS